MKCPVCGIDLLMTERLHEPIDYCPQCRGIWLEKGKLDKMLEYSQGEREETGRQFGKGDHDDDQHGGQRRPHKRSLFELFD